MPWLMLENRWNMERAASASMLLASGGNADSVAGIGAW
jgi:hypothetical protein